MLRAGYGAASRFGPAPRKARDDGLLDDAMVSHLWADFDLEWLE